MKNAALEKSSRLEYFNIAISVDCVIFGYEDKQLKVLLIKSDLEEFKGMWSLLGDLVRPDEDLEAASYRILQERTGLEDVYLEQVYTFGATGRHPSGRVITTAYYALIDIAAYKLNMAGNELYWHPVNQLGKMAFDHKQIVATCLQRLQEAVMEHPIVFNLIPRKFSLRELQDVYEAILGVELDRRNFRKRITLKGWLDDLNEMEEDVPHRPGKVYCLKDAFGRHGKKKLQPAATAHYPD